MPLRSWHRTVDNIFCNFSTQEMFNPRYFVDLSMLWIASKNCYFIGLKTTLTCVAAPEKHRSFFLWNQGYSYLKDFIVFTSRNDKI